MAGRADSFSGARRQTASTQHNGLVGSVARFWQRSYAADYVGLAMILGAFTLVSLSVEPFHRMFSLDNLAIQYPHATVERVPVPWLFTYAGAIPLGLLVLWAILVRPGVHQVHVTILGLFISLILTSFLTDVVKNAVGRPRPDLISRCKPKDGTPEHSLVNFDVCTESDHHILHDGWRSFPSGHSSFAFSGLGYLALFFSGQMHVFRPRTDLARVLIALAPLLGAALIAISRCEDYRHDVYDVTIGSLLGILVAYFSYRRYYPSLRSSNCDIPFPSRAEMFNRAGLKMKDDEEYGRGSAHATADPELDEEAIPLRNQDGVERGGDH